MLSAVRLQLHGYLKIFGFQSGQGSGFYLLEVLLRASGLSENAGQVERHAVVTPVSNESTLSSGIANEFPLVVFIRIRDEGLLAGLALKVDGIQSHEVRCGVDESAVRTRPCSRRDGLLADTTSHSAILRLGPLNSQALAVSSEARVAAYTYTSRL